MKTRALQSLLALAFLCPATGCLFTHASERVIRSDEQLYEVGFQSELAESTFLACVANPSSNADAKSGSFVGIPFLLAWARSERLSKNAIHNDQVILCDTNGDGLITDAEALRYRDRFHPGLDLNQSLAAVEEEDDEITVSFATDTAKEKK